MKTNPEVEAKHPKSDLLFRHYSNMCRVGNSCLADRDLESGSGKDVDGNIYLHNAVYAPSLTFPLIRLELFESVYCIFIPFQRRYTIKQKIEIL